MSVMNFQQSFRDVKPPEKGSFPLDHEDECKAFMVRYMRCLRDHAHNNTECRVASKEYLECRMERNLMAKEDLANLGFADLASKDEKQNTNTTPKDAK